MAIDLKRTKDRETLRQVAILQDAEIRRLHEKLQALAVENAKLKGLSGEAPKEQLRLIEKEIAQATNRAAGGSERRPRPDSENGERKKPQKGHGRQSQPALPSSSCLTPSMLLTSSARSAAVR